MKKSNLLTFFTKAVFTCVVSTAMAKAAFAQITLDLGVLMEEPPAPAETASPKAAPQKTEKASGTASKETQKATPAAKPAPAKRPVKPVVKKSVQPKEKYQVKETLSKDEHDKLKPHAAPVPKVKILTASNNEVPEEEDYPFDTGVKKVRSAKEPRLSKHFLEQQRLKSERALKTAAPAEPVETAKQEQRPVTPQQLKTAAEKFERETAGDVAVKTPAVKAPSSVIKESASIAKENAPAVKEAPSAVKETASVKPENIEKKKPVEPEKTVFAFSVFPVSEDLTMAERSALLSKEIPQESATFKALSERRMLRDILNFERKTIELTPDMQTALDKVASILKKDRKKRLVLYAYASEDPTEPGKERQYALRRALMVRSYLIVQGIHSLRIELRSQGQKGAGDKIPDRTDLVLQDR